MAFDMDRFCLEESFKVFLHCGVISGYNMIVFPWLWTHQMQTPPITAFIFKC